MPDKKPNPFGSPINGRTFPWILLVLLMVALAWMAYWKAVLEPLARETPAEETAVAQATGTGTEVILPDTGSPLPDGEGEAALVEMPEGQVGLYGLFEAKFTNNKSYSNPYDYRQIELSGEFTAPSGKRYSYFGFYDGDGNGGLGGNVWRMRFMPDEVGRWNFNYAWSDGTPGGSASFDVADTGIPGPLKMARDNPWYFENARGNPFNWRGYTLHLYLEEKYGRGVYSGAAWDDLNDKINKKVADRGYNALMLAWPVFTRAGGNGDQDNNGNHFWQQKGGEIDFTRFYIPQWQKVEETLKNAGNRQLYVFQFLALVDQETLRPNDDQMQIYLRYMAARLGSFWNNFGYSATWEYQDIWSISKANEVGETLHEGLSRLPTAALMGTHDHASNSFVDWLDFSMRQQDSRDVFDGNCRSCGQHGGVDSEFVDRPIVGSEDIWQYSKSSSMPTNGAEVRRGAWGSLLAGIMPVYMEDTGSSGAFNSEGEPEVRRMWDFIYSATRYREYRQLNNLISQDNGQVASGIPKWEYLVYDQNGGTIQINLSKASGTQFTATWFDPKTGKQQGGGSVMGGKTVSLKPPFGGDAVLLLKGAPTRVDGDLFLPIITN